MNITLKFPTGAFTHSELAAHNGRTNQQVWTSYQQAIKDGVIVFVGLRTGKGKPSKLFQVAGPGVVAATDTTKVIQSAPVVVPTTKPVKPKVEIVKKITVSSVDTNALIPVASAVTSEPDVELEDVVIEEAPKRSKVEVEPNYRKLDNMKCPICHQPCIAWDVANGVMVQCNQGQPICPCNENPYGFSSKNEKSAYEVLCQKYRP